MSDTKLYPFYYPWPNLGVKLSRQWDKLRDNTEKEAPLIRAAYVDAQPSSANEPGEHDLSGWAIGERDFRNKFRIYYDKSADRFSIQYNSGTEDVEIWNDYLSIRQVDGRVTVHGYGGLDTTVGGFYTPLSRNLAVSGTFTPESTEWVWEHSLNTKPILWNTFNLEDKSIIPQSVDVSNPNIAYFYFSQAYAGRAIAVAEVARGDGIRVTDGTNNYTQSTILSFNYGQFYISHGLEGYPTINLQPGAAGASDHGALTGLSDDDHSQYLLASDATDRATFAANWLDLTDGGATTLHSHAAGATDHGTLTGLSDDDHTQYSLADGTRAFTGTVEGIAPTADAHLTTKAYVDTRFADFYRNAVGSDHGGLTGLTDDDHSQYLLASDATNRATFAANWTDLTDGGATTLHSHAAADHGTLSGLSDDDHPQYLLRTETPPGFYGVWFFETDNTPPGFHNDTIYFDSESFYLHPNSVGKPVLSFRGATGVGGGVTDHGALTGLADNDHPQYLLKTQTPPGFYGVNFRETDGGPDFKNDTIYFDSSSFYLHPNSVGKPVLSFRGASGGGAGVSDHGALTGLADDDHSQYILADGTRAFTGPVTLPSGSVGSPALNIGEAGTGVYLPASGNLDLALTGGFIGARVTAFGLQTPDGIASNPSHTFINDTDTGLFLKGANVLGISARGVEQGYLDENGLRIHNEIRAANFYLTSGGELVNDHGALTGLADNDHPQYLLRTEASPGFYGVNFRETDGGPDFKNDTIYFNSSSFYLTSNSLGKPIVNFRGSAGTGTALTVKDIDGNPTVSNVSTIQFTNGSVTDQGGGVAQVTLGGGSGISTLTEGSKSFGSQTTLGFNSHHFYLSPGGTAGSKVLNLRYSKEIIPVFQELVTVSNFAIDPFVPYPYTIETVDIDCKSGSCVAAFYILAANARNKNGKSIVGLDPIDVSTSVARKVATANNSVNPGDCLMLSIPSNTTAKHLRISITAKKPN